MLVWRSIASNALTLFIVLLIGAAIGVAMAQNMWRAPGPLADAICLSVPRGSNMVRVSNDLAEQGAVTRPALLRIGAEYTDRAQQLKAGNFLIPAGSSMETIVDLVTRSGALDPSTAEFVQIATLPVGDPLPDTVARLIEQGFARTRVTVAEGVTEWQIAESLRAAPFLTGGIGELPGEGWLAPGSYDVPIAAGPGGAAGGTVAGARAGPAAGGCL